MSFPAAAVMTDPELEPVLIEWEKLSSVALQGVLEELVSRGEPDEVALATRCDQLKKALAAKKADLYFDPIEETVFLKNTK